MKKAICLLLTLSSALFSYPTCDRELAHALHKVYTFPEGEKLISDVEKEGAIHIAWGPASTGSSALWDQNSRTILINSRRRPNQGEVIRSIFFELHNALTSREFAYMDWQARYSYLSLEEYTVAVERLEHRNALAASEAIDRAIHAGYFPRTAYWPIAHDFSLHYRIQVECGHTRNIARGYRSLNRYSHHYGHFQSKT